MLRRLYKPLEGPGGMGCLYSDRKVVLEVPGLLEPTGLDHRDHRDLRAEGELPRSGVREVVGGSRDQT